MRSRHVGRRWPCLRRNLRWIYGCGRRRTGLPPATALLLVRKKHSGRRGTTPYVA